MSLTLDPSAIAAQLDAGFAVAVTADGNVVPTHTGNTPPARELAEV